MLRDSTRRGKGEMKARVQMDKILRRTTRPLFSGKGLEIFFDRVAVEQGNFIVFGKAKALRQEQGLQILAQLLFKLMKFVDDA